MNRASLDFAWTRKGGGLSSWGRYKDARKGRAIVTSLSRPAVSITFLILLTIACIRQAGPIQRSPGSFPSPLDRGAFSKLEKQMEDNYQVFLNELNDKQKQINDLKTAQGQLPAPRGD